MPNGAHNSAPAGYFCLQRSNFPRLFEILLRRGYRIAGPTVSDGAIIYDELTGVENLPIGWSEEQEAGYYRLIRRTDEALFGYAVGPHSWKKFLYPARQRLWRAESRQDGFEVLPEALADTNWAFLGVRSCDLHALGILDRVLGQGAYADPRYALGRAGALVVAVQCGQAGGACFCVSMRSGPVATSGFDLALTEVLDAGRHWFLVEAGSPIGSELAAELELPVASEAELAAARAVSQRTAESMGRAMPPGLEPESIGDLLRRNLEHPRWDNVARRCLTCGNCTLVCPTCFCTTVEDTTDLGGGHAERWRQWDSCFTLDFSYIHGGSVRASARSRYRQWMTHKLSTWFDQFGSTGCVGCGRCIVWCPVGIDITEEVRAISSSDFDREDTSDHGNSGA